MEEKKESGGGGVAVDVEVVFQSWGGGSKE